MIKIKGRSFNNHIGRYHNVSRFIKIDHVYCIINGKKKIAKTILPLCGPIRFVFRRLNGCEIDHREYFYPNLGWGASCGSCRASTADSGSPAQRASSTRLKCEGKKRIYNEVGGKICGTSLHKLCALKLESIFRDLTISMKLPYSPFRNDHKICNWTPKTMP